MNALRGNNGLLLCSNMKRTLIVLAPMQKFVLVAVDVHGGSAACIHLPRLALPCAIIGHLPMNRLVGRASRLPGSWHRCMIWESLKLHEPCPERACVPLEAGPATAAGTSPSMLKNAIVLSRRAAAAPNALGDSRAPLASQFIIQSKSPSFPFEPQKSSNSPANRKISASFLRCIP